MTRHQIEMRCKRDGMGRRALVSEMHQIDLSFPSIGTDDRIGYASLVDTRNDAISVTDPHDINRGVAAPESGVVQRSRRGRRWSDREQVVLHNMWGHAEIEEIATALSRSPRAVYREAGRLRLGLGAPNGFEYISASAARVGYSLGTLWRILRWYRIRVRHAVSHPAHTGRRSYYVEPGAVNDAVARWCALESASEAARRHGIPNMSMGRLLLAAEKRGDIVDARCGMHEWRLEPAAVDRVVAASRAQEDGQSAARRVGVSWPTMRAWIVAAGLRGSTRRWWVRPADIDRLVTEKRITSVRAFRTKKTAGGETSP